MNVAETRRGRPSATCAPWSALSGCSAPLSALRPAVSSWSSSLVSAVRPGVHAQVQRRVRSGLLGSGSVGTRRCCWWQPGTTVPPHPSCRSPFPLPCLWNSEFQKNNRNRMRVLHL
eukprot:2915278-Rhodomonas_salina.1